MHVVAFSELKECASTTQHECTYILNAVVPHL